jgi:hypothetical protein
MVGNLVPLSHMHAAWATPNRKRGLRQSFCFPAPRCWKPLVSPKRLNEPAQGLLHCPRPLVSIHQDHQTGGLVRRWPHQHHTRKIRQQPRASCESVQVPEFSERGTLIKGHAVPQNATEQAIYELIHLNRGWEGAS